MSTKTSISIGGITIDIRSDSVSEEKIQKAANAANERVNAVLADFGYFDMQTALAFALFKLSGDYSELQYKYERTEESVNKLTGTAQVQKRSYTPAKKEQPALTEKK